MNPLRLSFLLLFAFLTTTASAQNLANRLTIPNLEETTALADANKNPKQPAISFEELDRAVRQSHINMIDSDGVVIIDNELHVKKTPAILWGLLSGAGYFGANYALYGGLENAGIVGLVVSTVGGILMGTIVNQAKRQRIIRER